MPDNMRIMPLCHLPKFTAHLAVTFSARAYLHVIVLVVGPTLLSIAEQGILPAREQDARTSRKIREQSPNGTKRSARHSTHARSF